MIQTGWVDDRPVTDPKHKQLLITQSDDDGANKPVELLHEAEKIMIDDMEVWVLYPDLTDPTQIYFWKEEQYYNVRGLNIPLEELIKVASSLIQP